MYSWIASSAKRLTAITLVLSAIAAFAFAQEDPDPNSPTPVLITDAASTRAIATDGTLKSSNEIARSEPKAFALGSRVVLYATNISLLPGEGANAFRLYATDKNGRQYRFPVVAIEQITKGTSGIYALTAELNDAIGFWSAPEQDGDILIQLTWRGLGSNSVRLGLGQVGGNVADAPGSVPTPVGFNGSRLTKGTPAATNTPDFVGYRWSGDRMRFLEQATFGPNPALDARIRRIGLRTWLTEQFEAPYPSATNPYPNQPLKPANIGTDPLCDGGADDVPVTCVRDTYSMYQPQIWFFREAFYGDAQLRHRVSWALNQIWVTSGVDVQQGRHMVEYHKVLSKHAFGNFRNLMKDMTLNPAMGGYLDMAISTRTNPNENYAREIMQLFSIGLFMLNQDGTLMLDGNNNPIPTYDQNVVNNLTKVLTGWGFCQTQALCPNLAVGTVNYIDPLLLNVGVATVGNNRHDLTAKTLLTYPGSTTTNVAACTNCTTLPNIETYANNSMNQALDNIFNHPNVGPYIGKILIQQLVTSDPTPAYVGRVAAAFNDNGSGVRGDMKAVIRAILLDPEARGNVKTDPNYGKLREPVLFATNILRTFGVRSADGLSQSDGYLVGRAEFTGMAQTPFMSPTVFNFYPPDYKVPGTTLLGPEFAIMTTGTSIGRTNFVNRFVFSTLQIPSPTSAPVPVSVPNSPNGTTLDFGDLIAISASDATGNLLLDELNNRMLHGTMSAQMKATILPAVTSVVSTDNLGRVRQAVYLVATSSQYQVQR